MYSYVKAKRLLATVLPKALNKKLLFWKRLSQKTVNSYPAISKGIMSNSGSRFPNWGSRSFSQIRRKQHQTRVFLFFPSFVMKHQKNFLLIIRASSYTHLLNNYFWKPLYSMLTFVSHIVVVSWLSGYRHRCTLTKPLNAFEKARQDSFSRY